MARPPIFILLAWLAVSLGAAIALARVESIEAVPAFARQYDVQCNACHTRPPRLNSFGEQFHLMGFQMPSAARRRGLVAAYKEDEPLKFLLDTVALRAEGGIFEYTYAPSESETKFAPPDEITLYLTRPITPDFTFFVELEYAPNAAAFENGRYFTEGEAGVGHEAFFMLNLGRVLGLLGAPTMEMGGMTMVGRHVGFNLHGPMMMAGKVDPSTNFSYPTNRQMIPQPRNFTSNLFKLRSTPSGQLPTTADLFRTVSEGIRGDGGPLTFGLRGYRIMPGFHQMPAEQRLELLEYVRVSTGASGTATRSRPLSSLPRRQ